MSVEAPERIWAASVTDSYGEWQTVKDGLPRPVEYVRADKLEELAAEKERVTDALSLANRRGDAWKARAEAAEAHAQKLREACNQSRLAFAGMVSVQSAIDKLDACATKEADHAE